MQARQTQLVVLQNYVPFNDVDLHGSATPPRVYKLALETCSTVKICIGHVHKGNRTLIRFVL